MGYKKSVFRSLVMVSQLGLCVLTPILFCILAGGYIDARYGTKTLVILVVLGTLGGGRAAYVMAKRLIDDEAKASRKEEEERIQKVLEEAGGSVSKPKTASRVIKPKKPVD